ncbi:hypothetical protein VLK31_27405 [Variovorax sp. H27-G14]|uniref:hypothetical protein n=1 Tax=Variovorax sp. H27-G14 TaxID=3111914 RepID=UPI0038FD141C
MFERIYEYFLTEPRRLIDLGNNLVRTGAFLLVLGAIGNVMTGVSAVALSFGKQTVNPQTLADLYPSIPTWFVPESIIGCVPAILMMLIGFSVASMGHRLKRAYF